jgi:hypothetical protein
MTVAAALACRTVARKERSGTKRARIVNISQGLFNVRLAAILMALPV